RVDLNGATVITDRRVAFALFNADGPTVEVSVGVARVQLDSAVVITERSGQVSLLLFGDAAVVVGGGGRIKSNGEVEIGDGAMPFSFRQPLIAAFEIGSR